jgi:hypothetical protein
MWVKANRQSVNLWTADTVAYPFGLVHVVKDTETKVPDDVVDFPGFQFLVDDGDLAVLTPPDGGGGETPVAPTGTPSETGVLNQPMLDSTNDIVALADKATTVTTGDSIKVGASEYMTITDASDQNNLKVTRGAFETEVVEHAAGDQVSMWGTLTGGTALSDVKRPHARPGRRG